MRPGRARRGWIIWCALVIATVKLVSAVAARMPIENRPKAVLAKTHARGFVFA